MPLARFTLIVASIVLGGILGGCATVMGVTKPIRLKGKPAHAEIFINGKPRGRAPVEAQVSRWGSHRIRIEAAGFEPCEFRLEKTYNAYAHGNVFIGIAPIAIDLLTGAALDFTVPESARKRNGHEVIHLRPGPLFDTRLDLVFDLAPQRPGR